MGRVFYNWGATSLESVPLDEVFFDNSCAISGHDPRAIAFLTQNQDLFEGWS